MSSTVSLILLSISVLHVEVNCYCSAPIGTNSETQGAIRDESFYINTDHPAPCNGTINGLRYCFYKPGGIRNNRNYKTTFAIYRAVNTSYQRMSNVTTVSWRGSEIKALSQSFNCYNVNVNSYTVQAGDLVAACIYDPGANRGSERQLDVVGWTWNYGDSLMGMNDVSQCNETSLPSNILNSQLSDVNWRMLHLYATITVPATPTTPTTTMSTTEQTTTVTWTMVTTTTSETTTMDMTTETTTRDMTTKTTAMDITTETTTRDMTTETTAMDMTTAPSDGGDFTTIMTSSSTTTPAAPTTSSITTTQADTASEARTSSTPQTVSMTTVEPTTDHPMTTTSEGTISTTDATNKNDQPTTPESGETSSITQATPTLSSDESISAETDTTMIKDDDVSTVAAQIGAQNSGPEIIIGVTIVVVLLIVTGLVVAIIIVAVIFKKQRKGFGGYSLPGEKPKSNGTAGIASNGVDNCMYDVGFHNPGTLDSSINLYKDVTNSVTVSTGEGNYFELAESGFINQTYESVNDAGIYSELSATHTSDTQADRDHQNPSGGVSCYELECYSASPEDSKKSLSFLLERNKQEDIYGNLEAYYAPASNEDDIYSQLKSCGTNNIPHVHIRIMGHLGSGQFGNVEKGMWQSKEVALKTLKTGSTKDDKVKFLQEAAIMAQFRHPNIVTLHGVVSDKEPLMLVVELMHRGDLRDHLHSIRPDPGELPMAGLSEMLLSFSQHVALGMQYLSGKGFVHRDLAARNILVSKDNICKVADFGMSRDLADETYYVSHGGMIPVKWTAPEAIHYKKYSTASDVWSYGCLLYEIWSLGWKPFEGMANHEVVRILDSNKRLSPPPGCPRMIYELMIKCWDSIAGSRPRFREIVIVLTSSPQDVLSIPQEALDVHRLAGVLGSPLEVAKNMYNDLQNKYYCSE